MSLFHAEYLKVSRRKLYPIMTVLLSVLMVFIGVLFYVILPALPEAQGGGAAVPQRPEAFIFGAQQVAGQAWWFAVILATAVLGGEVATTVWATGLTRDSRKPLHVIARFIVFTIASWLAFLIGAAVWMVITWAFAEGTSFPETAEWLGLIWKFIFIAAAWTSIGLGAVAMTRSIAVAMGVALGLSFVDSIVAPFVDLYENISLSAATNGIFGVGGDDAFSALIAGGDMTTVHAVTVIAGWTVLALMMTWWGLQRSDA
jgi:hypothetical protein